ncbi:hypothetical protein IV203_030864 [Nitzschia inconspicua]|uniref:Uncharacterized protein n=1 Tax=Nitzschia inconspicua TaxID=303405 RepID=A0A9K3LW35_9STRA|nr:hypothetical protein IV203_030864 [Nitzschia inconspicua]
MKSSTASVFVFPLAISFVGVNGQLGNNTGFQDPMMPVGATVPPPVFTPINTMEIPTATPNTNTTEIPTATPSTNATEVPTAAPSTNTTEVPSATPSITATDAPTSVPSEEPTISLEPTDFPTPAPSVNNQDVCDIIDDDWEEWYEERTRAEHTCECQATVEGLAEDRVQMNCFGEELYCCAVTGVCYDTDDASEHIIADRLYDGIVDLATWQSCVNIYQGGVENPRKTHRLCREYGYAPQTAVSRQETTEPALAWCRVIINDQECTSCTPCEENGPGMTGYDCTNIRGVDQIPLDALPMGPQSGCHFQDFPVCTFNGAFIDVDKSVVSGGALPSFVVRISVPVLLAGGALVWN